MKSLKFSSRSPQGGLKTQNSEGYLCSLSFIISSPFGNIFTEKKPPYNSEILVLDFILENLHYRKKLFERHRVLRKISLSNAIKPGSLPQLSLIIVPVSPLSLSIISLHHIVTSPCPCQTVSMMQQSLFMAPFSDKKDILISLSPH